MLCLWCAPQWCTVSYVFFSSFVRAFLKAWVVIYVQKRSSKGTFYSSLLKTVSGYVLTYICIYCSEVILFTYFSFTYYNVILFISREPTRKSVALKI